MPDVVVPVSGPLQRRTLSGPRHCAYHKHPVRDAEPAAAGDVVSDDGLYSLAGYKPFDHRAIDRAVVDDREITIALIKRECGDANRLGVAAENLVYALVPVALSEPYFPQLPA